MRKIYLPIIIIIAILAVAGVYYAIKNWQPALPEGEPPIIEDRISRKEVITDVSEKIAEISPKRPVLGGEWFVTRFWFVQGSNENLYIEYEDGHNLRQVLVEAKKVYPERSRGEDGILTYKIIGYFEPGEVSWDLKDGEDKFFGSLLDLYEYNEELEEWIKRN